MKPELDGIIRSPEAERFLRMVTKGFYDNSYIGLWMYEVIGREWDEMRAWAEQLRTEIFPQTCTWSIAIWEWVYGFEPDDSLTLERRRQRILSKIFGAKPVNPEVIRRGVEALTGGNVEIEDFTGPYRFDITIHTKEGSLNPMQTKEAADYIRMVKPAHLAVGMAEEARREFRHTILFRQAAFCMTKISADYPNTKQSAEISLNMVQGAFIHPRVCSDSPDMKRTVTNSSNCAGGLFCHTHIKPKVIE